VKGLVLEKRKNQSTAGMVTLTDNKMSPTTFNSANSKSRFNRNNHFLEMDMRCEDSKAKALVNLEVKLENMDKSEKRLI